MAQLTQTELDFILGCLATFISVTSDETLQTEAIDIMIKLEKMRGSTHGNT